MKRQKKFFTVRKKLIAAASSLGIAMVMVVSSTYAWFTLSTAPEVTGISTQIGANGNLEMALLPSSGEVGDIGNGVVDASTPKTTANTYWGNLVDLSDPDYGLKNINLQPARLNATGNDANGYTIASSSILKTPTYGTDGRISLIEANTSSAIADEDRQFKTTGEGKAPQYGVRAIGTANGRSPQQTALVNAKSAIVANKALALSAAQRAVSLYGNGIANIAVKHALAGEETDTYTAEEIKGIKEFASALKTSFDYIDAALRQAVVACATTETNTTTFNTAKGLIENTANPLTSLASTVSDAIPGFTIPTGISECFDKVKEDQTELQRIIDANWTSTGADGTYVWKDFASEFGGLVDYTEIKINGKDVSEAMGDKGALASSIMSIGLTVSAPSGSGFMADVADYAGSYSAKITIDHLEYNGLALDNVDAKLEATTSKDSVYLDKAATAAAGITAAGDSTTAATLTDYYGYALDFAFRTNAANSNLLLQKDDAQRIYSDSQNSLTQGGGSFLEFTSNDLTMFKDTGGVNNLARLMSAIRIVFTDESGKILAIGATSNRTIDKTEAEGGPCTYSESITDKYKVNGSTVKAYISLYDFTIQEGVLKLTNPHKDKDDTETDALLALTQNTAMKLTTIVYLDGDIVDNTMVSAFETISGNLNLQFASDATLVPMENSELRGTEVKYTEYTYDSKSYYKTAEGLWYTKSDKKYTQVVDTALIAQLNTNAAEATPPTEEP